MSLDPRSIATLLWSTYTSHSTAVPVLVLVLVLVLVGVADMAILEVIVVAVVCGSFVERSNGLLAGPSRDEPTLPNPTVKPSANGIATKQSMNKRHRAAAPITIGTALVPVTRRIRRPEPGVDAVLIVVIGIIVDGWDCDGPKTPADAQAHRCADAHPLTPPSQSMNPFGNCCDGSTQLSDKATHEKPTFPSVSYVRVLLRRWRTDMSVSMSVC